MLTEISYFVCISVYNLSKICAHFITVHKVFKLKISQKYALKFSATSLNIYKPFRLFYSSTNLLTPFRPRNGLNVHLYRLLILGQSDAQLKFGGSFLKSDRQISIIDLSKIWEIQKSDSGYRSLGGHHIQNLKANDPMTCMGS